ncbi:MAG: hypothetical protein JEZ04_01570 [Spirochaetales bacterium]|nr:hypothetical protein [Spirochaetales bacterium]
MSLNNRLISPESSRLSVFINDKPVPDKVRLLRLYAGDYLTLKVEITSKKSWDEFLLHTDLGGSWSYLSFNKDETDESCYTLELKIAGAGEFCFRYAASDENSLYWEPAPYHRLLADPAVMDGLTMYTLIPNVSGPVSAWSRKLPEIAAMGFNTIHLLPVTMMGSSESPYSAADLFSLDPAWGKDIGDFKTFAKEASAAGIMLCLDMVLNHISIDNPVCTKHADWLIPDDQRPDGLKRAGCWHHRDWISWEDLVLINYDHPVNTVRAEIYDYMRSYIDYWIEASGGKDIMIRLDNLHSSNQPFIGWLLPEIRLKWPDVIILSEYFGAEDHLNEAVQTFGLNLLMANSWEYPFAPVLQNYLSGLHSPETSAKYLIEPSSHDTGSIPELFGSVSSSIPRYLCCALMGTGQTGIIQGFEYGAAEKINFIGRIPEKRPEAEWNFTGMISAVNNILHEYPCFRKKGNIVFLETGCDSLIACRRTGEGAEFIIAVNLDTGAQHDLYINSGNRFQFILSENVERESTDNKIVLKACGVCVLKNIITV